MATYKRSVYSVVLNKPDDYVHGFVQDYMAKKGFTYKTVKGQQVWKKGIGMLAAPRLFRYQYINGVLTVEAWLHAVFLPGICLSEMDLEGVYGFAIKEAFKRDIQQLFYLLQQPMYM